MDQTLKKKRDPYRNLKFIGYKKGQLPERYTLKEFTEFCKMQLASKTRTLLKDPIWDSYTSEELIIEFYAHQFLENDKARMMFETELGSGNETVDEFSAWADKQIQKEAKIRDGVLGESEDSIKFSPEDVMGEES
jgi:hypothetical protein